MSRNPTGPAGRAGKPLERDPLTGRLAALKLDRGLLTPPVR